MDPQRERIECPVRRGRGGWLEMLVRHYMTSNVQTLQPKQTCREAMHEMRRLQVRRMPVLEHERLVGIVTLSGLYQLLPRTPAQAETPEGVGAEERPIQQIMATPVKTLQPNDHLEAAAQMMLAAKVSGVPVVRDGRLVGIITESDIFRAVWQVLGEGGGVRVILEEHHQSRGGQPDYTALLVKHFCRLHSFMRFPGPESGDLVHLRVVGSGTSALVDDLAASSATILSVERST